MRQCRPFINPNPGFLHGLSQFEVRPGFSVASPHSCVHQLKLRGTCTIRFPDEPLTIKTVYEWLGDDGVWRPRLVVTDASKD